MEDNEKLRDELIEKMAVALAYSFSGDVKLPKEFSELYPRKVEAHIEKAEFIKKFIEWKKAN